ncbi:hypothetical protein BJF85_16345 [Saccharomonospora sp. CUA-673]|nr:hypothetical protein BJF85_16345 [Saccharomonospora sp. CUA-673]
MDLDLHPGVHTPTAARHAVDDAVAQLPEVDEHARQNASLLVTELVTNAVVHGSPPSRLRVQAAGGRLRIAVSDHGSRPPVLMHPGPELGHGRGLLLVSTLAADWGVEYRARGGKVVWAELPMETATSPRSRVAVAHPAEGL